MLTISYDGSNFKGSQRQGRHRTVQAEVERALTELWGKEAKAAFAGRTDTGVHATGQVVSSEDFRPDLADWQIKKAINARLPVDVSVESVRRRPAEFNARFDAIWREYRYRVWSGSRQPLMSSQVVQRERRLNVEAMSEAAKVLVGSHDFAAFAGNGEGVPWFERQESLRGSIRAVYLSEVVVLEPWWAPRPENGNLVEIRVVADGFLPRMVRTIAGVLLEVGYGNQQSDWIEELIAQRDRRMAGETAPAHGLIFWRVGYAGDVLPGTDLNAQVGQ